MLPTFILSSVIANNGDAEKAEPTPEVHVSTRQLYDDELEDDEDEDDHHGPSSQLASLISPGRPPISWYSKLKSVVNPKDEKDIADYVPNYRYTPILSGIIIPLSILLEIPGLTENWYVRTLNNKTVETRRNPMILDIGLAFSMACGVAANIALIVRFLEKRVKLMTVLCIIFLTLHDLINIVAVTVFGVEHRFNDGFTYGHSFYLTLCSTIVSSFTNITLITDLHRTAAFDSSGSGLTRKQRSLVIMVMGLLCYVSFGALIHGILMDLTFVDSLYFTLCTIETIGFGDIVLRSAGPRVFTCFYAVLGILLLALAVSVARDTVLEGLEVAYRKRVQNMRERRRIANWKRRVSRRWREAVEWRLKEASKPVWVRNHVLANKQADFVFNWFNRLAPWASGNSWFGKESFLGTSPHPHGMHLNLEALSGPQLEAAAMEAGVPLNALLPPSFWKRHNEIAHGPNDSHAPPPVYIPDMDMPLTQARMGRMINMVVNFGLAVDRSGWLKGGPLPDAPPTGTSNFTNITMTTAGTGATRPSSPKPKPSLSLEYDTFQTSMQGEERKAFIARLTVVWVIFLTFWMIGSVVFMKTEDWSFGIAMYFCFIAFTTIGYGDFSPKSPAGRSFFVAWALLGVATMTILISVLSEAYSSRYKNIIHSNVFDHAVKRYRARLARPRKRHRNPPPPILDAEKIRIIPESSNGEHAAISESRKRATEHLEALPHHVLDLTRDFHHFMEYFVKGGDMEQLPDALQDLLDEITGMENLVIGERHKQEILQDATSRQALFTLGIEKAIRKMRHSAEEAIDALSERDYLIALQHHENAPLTSPGIQTPMNSPGILISPNVSHEQIHSSLMVPTSPSSVRHGLPSAPSTTSVHFID
ncbi:hypothetical protein C8J56DRAFT_850011 [Mycena floridula]|nr:hypothetical protein C8J56DRAFT_850011 [Mycena floridula]